MEKLNILYRNKSDPPNKTGFYFGRHIPDGRIRPFEVIDDTGLFFAEIGSEAFHVSEFEWFGPVPECREG